MQTEQLYTQSEIFLPAIEDALKSAVAITNQPRLEQLHAMMAYHMGWQGEGAGRTAQGKRIRPLLVLLTCDGIAGNWENALPAAAAVELIHNFSLLHDDIEDNSPLRRGRTTAWVKWGVPQAINTGDAMFTLAHLALLQLDPGIGHQVILQAVQILQNTCLKLTQGQYLDISYEDRTDLTLDDYWPMITGKTATLLGTCTELGALIGGASLENQANYKNFGIHLGLAFQVLDDILGIWGDSAKIGKSNASDLVTGKKSLPVLYGLMAKKEFAARWLAGKIQPEEVANLAALLEKEGGREYAQKIADQHTQLALAALNAAEPKGNSGLALQQLARKLLQREI